MESPTIIQKFLLSCSGANRKILDECPTEWNKYTGIGGAVFFTGLLASISGGYALFTIFRSEAYAYIYASIFGIIWGLLIFNLDRFIVSSIRKEGQPQKELLYAFPRLIMALLISVVIAKPIEVKLFESRIEQQILEHKLAKLISDKNAIDEINSLGEIKSTTNKKQAELNYLDSIQTLEPSTKEYADLTQKQRLINNELRLLENTNKPKINQHHLEIRQLKNNINNYSIQRDSLGKELSRKLLPQVKKTIDEHRYLSNLLQLDISKKEKEVKITDQQITDYKTTYYTHLNKRIESKQDELFRSQNALAKADSLAEVQYHESRETKEKSFSNNFITQLEAMGKLSQENETIKWTSTLIMLLFIFVETAPILIKLLTKRGPYDEILDRIELERKIAEHERVFNSNIKMKELAMQTKEIAKLEGEAYANIERYRIEQDILLQKKAIDLLQSKKQDFSELSADNWYNKEVKKLLEIDKEKITDGDAPYFDGLGI